MAVAEQPFLVKHSLSDISGVGVEVASLGRFAGVGVGVGVSATCCLISVCGGGRC